MTQASQVEELKTKHSELETKIENEINRPHPDDSIVTQLKREKLRIKDELAQMGE